MLVASGYITNRCLFCFGFFARLFLFRLLDALSGRKSMFSYP